MLITAVTDLKEFLNIFEISHGSYQHFDFLLSNMNRSTVTEYLAKETLCSGWVMQNTFLVLFNL